MTYISENWSRLEESRKKAREHTEEMDLLYPDETKHSVDTARIHNTANPCMNAGNEDMEIEVHDADSVSAIFRFQKAKTAVLNFASFKEPGGRFIDGSIAQEECLCHASNLYNVLVQFTDGYYKWNNENKNHALYKDRALYTPEIIFFSKDGEQTKCDVITCAAPNKSAAQKYCNISDEENADVLESRIQFLLSVAQEHEVKTLILGAYGCGVFGQAPKEVAVTFKKALQSAPWSFERVIFAIPDGRNQNLAAFKEVFEGASDPSDTEFEKESETSFFVVIADSYGKRKFISRNFPRAFSYTMKLAQSQRFDSREKAQKFIDGFNGYGKYPILNPEIREVIRIFKVLK